MAAQLAVNQLIAGSNPARGANGVLTQLGEYFPCKEEVIGSSPIYSTNALVTQLVE